MPSPLEIASLTDQSHEMTPLKISNDPSHSHLSTAKGRSITYLATQGVCTSSDQCKMISSMAATNQAIAITKNVLDVKTMTETQEKILRSQDLLNPKTCSGQYLA